MFIITVNTQSVFELESPVIPRSTDFTVTGNKYIGTQASGRFWQLKLCYRNYSRSQAYCQKH